MQELLDGIAAKPAWMQIVILAVATLGSEDLTTITAGVLAANGTLLLTTAMMGCFIGIFFGDGLLYLAGLVLGKHFLKLPFVSVFLSEDRVDRCAGWFDEHGIKIVLISRFIPGTRLPTYFAAGLLGSQARYFLPAAALATALWVPMLVGISWFFGDQMQQFYQDNSRSLWWMMLLLIVALFVVLRLAMSLSDWRSRRQMRSRLWRIFRWEFWPILALYIPVICQEIVLFIRHRFRYLPLISNPGIEYAGFIGESKTDILSAFDKDSDFIAPFHSVPEDSDDIMRFRTVCQWMTDIGTDYPIILKPDIGQRGDAVQIIRSDEGLQEYLQQARVKLIAQVFVPGPYEFGILYARLPNEENGRILGITGKEFIRIVGDGRSTVEELILRHPNGMGRYHHFLKRFQARLDEVLPEGQSLPLIDKGNHCLGTIFKDESHLVTPALTACIDDLSKSIDGFYIGRYDARAANLEDFRQGRAFQVIELNGATGEPSHIYDRRYKPYHAYSALLKHYRLLWKIGKQNFQHGAKPIKLRALLRSYLRYRRFSKTYSKLT